MSKEKVLQKVEAAKNEPKHVWTRETDSKLEFDERKPSVHSNFA